MLSADDINDVHASIYAWSDAWQSKNIDRYMSFYSPQFKSGTYDYRDRLEEKTMLFQRPASVFLRISEPDISFDGKLAIAEFTQEYKYLSLSTIGKKS